MKSHFLAATLALVVGFTHVIKADQLDEVPMQKPAAVLVKVDPQTKVVTIYQAPEIDARLKVASTLSSAESRNLVEDAVAKIAVPQNIIGQLENKPVSELDGTSSTSAWHARVWGRGWGWRGWGGGCGYGGGYYSTYYPYYQPYYYNWSQPYYYPGSFYYGNYGCNYGYGYSAYYGGCNYGFYF